MKKTKLTSRQLAMIEAALRKSCYDGADELADLFLYALRVTVTARAKSTTVDRPWWNETV